MQSSILQCPIPHRNRNLNYCARNHHSRYDSRMPLQSRLTTSTTTTSNEHFATTLLSPRYTVAIWFYIPRTYSQLDTHTYVHMYSWIGTYMYHVHNCKKTETVAHEHACSQTVSSSLTHPLSNSLAPELTLLLSLSLCVRAQSTLLIIAHRLNTIRDADRVIMLDDGNVVKGL